MRKSTLSLLLSFAIGAGGAAYVLPNYTMDSPKPATQYVQTVGDEASVSPTPPETPPVKPTVTEGDDGSLGGPVYNDTHRETPMYIYNSPPSEYNTPEPTAETPSDEPIADQPVATHTATGEPEVEADPVPTLPEVSMPPSPDEHTGEPSEPAAG